MVFVESTRSSSLILVGIRNVPAVLRSAPRSMCEELLLLYLSYRTSVSNLRREGDRLIEKARRENYKLPKGEMAKHNKKYDQLYIEFHLSHEKIRQNFASQELHGS